MPGENPGKQCRVSCSAPTKSEIESADHSGGGECAEEIFFGEFGGSAVTDRLKVLKNCVLEAGSSKLAQLLLWIGQGGNSGIFLGQRGEGPGGRSASGNKTGGLPGAMERGRSGRATTVISGSLYTVMKIPYRFDSEGARKTQSSR